MVRELIISVLVIIEIALIVVLISSIYSHRKSEFKNIFGFFPRRNKKYSSKESEKVTGELIICAGNFFSFCDVKAKALAFIKKNKEIADFINIREQVVKIFEKRYGIAVLSGVDFFSSNSVEELIFNMEKRAKELKKRFWYVLTLAKRFGFHTGKSILNYKDGSFRNIDIKIFRPPIGKPVGNKA